MTDMNDDDIRKLRMQWVFDQVAAHDAEVREKIIEDNHRTTDIPTEMDDREVHEVLSRFGDQNMPGWIWDELQSRSEQELHRMPTLINWWDDAGNMVETTFTAEVFWFLAGWRQGASYHNMLA